MVNYNNNVGFAAMPTATVDLEAARFPAAKRFSPPVPTQSLLADMCKNAGAPSSTRLSVVSIKHPSESPPPSYSAAFALPARTPDQFPAAFDIIGHQNLSVAHKDRIRPPAAPSRRHRAALPTSKADKSECSLLPCSRETEDSTVVFPQAEALCTVAGGQPLNFGEALFAENTLIAHEANTDTFVIKNTGIYELRYSLNYEVPTLCTLCLGFEGFPQSFFKQQIAQAPSRGRLCATVRLLLSTGTALRLMLMDSATATATGSVAVSNAQLEIKQLYQLNLICPDYNANDPAKNFQAENNFSPSVRT